MAIYRALGVVFLLVLVGGEKGGVAGHGSGSSCGFPAIYSLGDNSSDTGERQAMFGELGLPNGQTFFGELSGRYCDGRLIIDFIAERLGFPYLSSYLDSSYKTNFSHGANFATAGSSVRVAQSWSHFNLLRQVFQFATFKSRATTLYQNLTATGKNQYQQSILPRPDEYSKSLYIIDIGQNDFAYDFQNTTAEGARKSIPEVVNGIADAIFWLVDFYEARFFLIHNVGPVGCLPYNVKSYQKINPGGALDQNGCVKEQNEVIQEFNLELKKKIPELRAKHTNATITLVDMYTAKYNLISNAKSQGFKDPLKFCCGSYVGRYVRCGEKDNDGRVIGTACRHPAKYISWDGKHFTEAANRLLAQTILDGSMSDPPLPLTEACRNQ